MKSGKVVAIIPARGGSKRIPRKNCKLFHGKPMITWSISAALASGMFDQVIVSTDDEEIATISKETGAVVPFRRPAHLADEFTPTRPVINHAIEKLSRHIGDISFVCCIYPTAPFLSKTVIQQSGKKILDKKANFVFSCTSYAYPIQRALKINKLKEVEMFWPENLAKRSQDLEEAFHDAGQFYWGSKDAFLSGRSCFDTGSLPWVLPRYLVHDIDTPEDWKRAELIFKVLKASDDSFPM